MSQRDIIGLVLSYVYAFGLLFAAEGIRKWRGYPQDFTRKIVHIGAGMWVWGILYFFDRWYIGIIPFATFILFNYIFYRQTTFKAMDAQDSTPGTVYFAFSITVLYAWLWRTGGALDRAPIATAAVMAMTWGDAFAAIIGRRWGKRRYHIWKSYGRSWEGTIAMAVFSFVPMLITLLLLPGSALSPASIVPTTAQALVMAALGTVVATAAEALSPAGTDNLSVPLLTGAALFLMTL